MAAAGLEHTEMALEELAALPADVRSAPQYRAAHDCLVAALGHLRAREAVVAASAAKPLDVIGGPQVI